MTEIYDGMVVEQEALDVQRSDAMRDARTRYDLEQGEQAKASAQNLTANPMNSEMPSTDLYDYGSAEQSGVNFDPQPAGQYRLSLSAPPKTQDLEQLDVPNSSAEGTAAPEAARKPDANREEMAQESAQADPDVDVQLPVKHFKPGVMIVGGQDISTNEPVLATPAEPMSWAEEVVVGGMVDAVKGLINLRTDMQAVTGIDFDPDVFNLKGKLPFRDPAVYDDAYPESEEWTRALPRALATFAVPYMGAAKAVKAAQSFGAARFGKELLASAAASQVFDPRHGTASTAFKAMGWDESRVANILTEMGVPVKQAMDFMDSERQTRANGALAGRGVMSLEDSLLGLLLPGMMMTAARMGSGAKAGYKHLKAADWQQMQKEAMEQLNSSSITLRSGADPTDIIPLAKLALAKMGQGMNTIDAWLGAFNGDVYTLASKTMAYVNAYKEFTGELPYTSSKAATHYSRVPELTSLSVDKYGTGVDGLDRARKAVDRTYFYHGDHTKEPQLGDYKYQWEQKNLYDFAKDPLNFRQMAKDELIEDLAPWAKAAAHVPATEIATRKELMIKDAGYSGYYISEPNGRKTRSAGATFEDVILGGS